MRIKIPRNDDWTFYITVVDSNGDAVDITGWKIYFTVRATLPATVLSSDTSGNGAIIVKTVTSHTTPTSGITRIDLTNIDTNIDPGTYYYDVQIKDTENKIASTFASSFIIVADITRSIT